MMEARRNLWELRLSYIWSESDVQEYRKAKDSIRIHAQINRIRISNRCVAFL